MNNFITLFFLVAMIGAISAQYTKLVWRDCGSREIDFYDMDITPMPIKQPGMANIRLDAFFKRRLQGRIRAELNIIRTVSGIPLPVRCYLAGGFHVGSCTYDDICEIIDFLLGSTTFNPENCAPSLAEFGIDCTCPFNIRDGDVNIDAPMDLPDASTTAATFLASGDFDITVKGSDPRGDFGCLNLKFTVEPSNPGK